MSDFDAFADAPPQEEDPAADFLAREQEELAELNDDNFTGTGFTEQHPVDQFVAALGNAYESVVTVIDSVTHPHTTEPGGYGSGGGGFDSFGDNSQQDGVPASLDIFNAPQTNDDFGFVGGDSGEQIPGLDALDQRLDEEEPASQDPYSSVRSVDTQRKEPEKIRIWREEQKVMLEKKDVDEGEKMEEWREQAKKELDDWYRHRDEQFQKAKALNRESEAEFIKERDETMPGGEWEKICRLCEFNPKNSRSQKDISRMRSILLQLKQNPTVQAKA